MDRYYQEVDAALQQAEIPANLNNDAWLSFWPANEKNWKRFSVASGTLDNEATLRAGSVGKWDRIDFRVATFPPWVASTSGLSGMESFGRWSDANLAPTIRVVSIAAFPERFQLHLRMRCLTREVNSPATIWIAGRSFEVEVLDAPTDIHLEVENECKGNTIDIAPRSPSSPQERDQRRLGLGVETISIQCLDETKT